MGQVVSFPDEAARSTFLAEARAQRYMADRFGRSIHTASFSPAGFPWDQVVRRTLVEKGIVSGEALEGLADLADLHTILTAAQMDVDDGEMNLVSRAFYEPGEAFEALYERFVAEVVAPECGEPVWWQRTPTIRFQFPNQKGADWKVCYHTDLMLGHPPQELNVWVPLTRVYGANSMCLAPLEPSREILEDVGFDFEDFAARVQYDDAMARRCAQHARPVELRPGQYLIFDPRCLHATQRNDTAHTRISMDLRVLPASQQARMGQTYRGTGRRRMLFAPGHYYDARLSSEVAGALRALADAPLPGSPAT